MYDKLGLMERSTKDRKLFVSLCDAFQKPKQERLVARRGLIGGMLSTAIRRGTVPRDRTPITVVRLRGELADKA